MQPALRHNKSGYLTLVLLLITYHLLFIRIAIFSKSIHTDFLYLYEIFSQLLSFLSSLSVAGWTLPAAPETHAVI